MLTVAEAVQKIKSLSKTFGEEYVPLSQAAGRVLAEDVFSDRDYPPFNRATMDGIALRFEDFNKGIRQFDIFEEVFAGDSLTAFIPEGKCIKIMTGAAVPKELDLVVRVEDLKLESGCVKVNVGSAFAFQNIARQGEDVLRDELILTEGKTLTLAEISALAVVGKSNVKVKKMPTVAVVSTGNEIKSIDESISSNQIRDSNSYAIQAFLKNYGIAIAFRKLVKDDKEELSRAIQEALKYDIVITSGGVSMGDADFMPSIFALSEVETDFHKVQVKPGKPLWVGHNSTSMVFGLPGNPVSVMVACKVFIEPYIRSAVGLNDSLVLKLPIFGARKKKTKFDEFFPCKIVSNFFSEVVPIEFNGSGDITATINSHGIGLHPADTMDLKEGDIISFFPWQPL